MVCDSRLRLLVIRHELLVLLVRQDAPGRNVPLGVIILAKLRNDDTLIGGRMVKLSVSDINADMRDAAAVRVEKHEISSAEIFLAYFCALLSLSFGSVRQFNAEFGEYPRSVSGTVKALLGCARPFVGGAQSVVDGCAQRRLGESAADMNTAKHR